MELEAVVDPDFPVDRQLYHAMRTSVLSLCIFETWQMLPCPWSSLCFSSELRGNRTTPTRSKWLTWPTVSLLFAWANVSATYHRDPSGSVSPPAHVQPQLSNYLSPCAMDRGPFNKHSTQCHPPLFSFPAMY